MKISYDWLREYIKVKESPAKIADILTRSGSEVKTIEKAGSDSIMDMEITPNRSDCLSYIGVGREISALTGKKVRMPPLKIQSAVRSPQPTDTAPFAVEIKDKALCPRYTARLVKNVIVKESPGRLKKRILSMGLRPVNNIVDITNFVLFETGQPMHAFDYDKIKGKTVIIRGARQGEKITSIDNIERKLDKEMLIIADKEKPIAIGGVMGGLNTEVTGDTKNILLESAYFDPVSVRRTSFKLALMSESSYRFERGVDPEMVLAASDRAALLIKDICGGEIGELLDRGSMPGKPRKISLRTEYVNKILNLNFKDSYIKKVLTRLFLKTSSSKKGVIEAAVPSFRQDLNYEIDLVEEISRIYGYENIGTTIPKTIPSPERKSLSWRIKEKAAEILTSLGLNEVITYSLVGESALASVFGDSSGGALRIKNPLSAEQELMRTSLISGALNVLSYNVNRGIRDLKIFEIGDVYHKDSKEGYSERTNICITLTGLSSSDWQRQKGSVTFFDLKGVLASLFREFGLEDFQMKGKPVSFLTKDSSCEIYYKRNYIGRAGCLAGHIGESLDLKDKVFLAEINLDALMSFVNLDKRFRNIPKYPSIKRDISLIMGGDVLFESIISLVKEQAGELVENIGLFDEYAGKQIPAGHHGLTFRIEYRDRKKTLTSEEVDKIHSAIRKSLVEKLRVTLR